MKDDVVDDDVEADLLINDVKTEDSFEVVVNDNVNDDDVNENDDTEDVEVVAWNVKAVVADDCIVDLDVDDDVEDDVLEAPEIGSDEDVKGVVGSCAAVTSAAVAEAQVFWKYQISRVTMVMAMMMLVWMLQMLVRERML